MAVEQRSEAVADRTLRAGVGPVGALQDTRLCFLPEHCRHQTLPQRIGRVAEHLMLDRELGNFAPILALRAAAQGVQAGGRQGEPAPQPPRRHLTLRRAGAPERPPPPPPPRRRLAAVLARPPPRPGPPDAHGGYGRLA